MIQYGSFAFPNDPERLEITYGWKVVSKETNTGAWQVRRLGRLGRVIEGEGIFYGDSPGASFRSLAALLDGQAHAFSHPVYGSINACMTELVSDEQAENGILRYRFRLLEIL